MKEQNETEEKLYLHGVYRHYKGGIYDVIGTALCSETQNPFVVYRSFDTGKHWIRPLDEFLSTKEIKEGQSVKRFELIGLQDATVHINKE